METAAKHRLRFWLQLLKASKHVENELRERMRCEFGTTLPRFDVMAMLAKSGDGLKMSQLSDALMVSNGNVTGIVDRLVGEGLIERVAIKGDRRATLVRLTTKGKTDFSHMAEVHENWINELFKDINDQDINSAGATLAQIRELT
ncbi:MAG: DNA-binding MarR family transcriptional regulator [Paracoccaceae bacterium]|jgi:DNA-binding MarR family transcriptional regulator